MMKPKIGGLCKWWCPVATKDCWYRWPLSPRSEVLANICTLLVGDESHAPARTSQSRQEEGPGLAGQECRGRLLVKIHGFSQVKKTQFVWHLGGVPIPWTKCCGFGQEMVLVPWKKLMVSLPRVATGRIYGTIWGG